MEPAGCALVVVLIALVVAAVIVAGAMKQSQYQAMESVARRWEGRALSTSWFADPASAIRIDGIGARIECRSSDQPWTRVRIYWSTPRRLRVVPEGFSSWLRRAFGGSDVSLGDPEFDAAFWVESSDPAWARAILDADIRRRLQDLTRTGTWLAPANVTLDVGPEGLMLRVSRVIVNRPNELENLIQGAAAVLRKIRGGAPTPGVKLAAVETQAGSACPVCGHRVEGDGRNCPKCGTPHHADCWKYSGGCAIYGCAARARTPAA